MTAQQIFISEMPEHMRNSEARDAQSVQLSLSAASTYVPSILEWFYLLTHVTCPSASVPVLLVFLSDNAFMVALEQERIL